MYSPAPRPEGIVGAFLYLGLLGTIAFLGRGPARVQAASWSAPKGRPECRITAGVRVSRAAGPCITTPSTSTNTSRGPHVSIGLEFAHRVHGRDRGVRGLERGQHLRRWPPTDPGRDDRVELLAMLAAAHERVEPWIVADADEFEDALRDRFGRGRHRNPTTVGALILPRGTEYGMPDPSRGWS